MKRITLPIWELVASGGVRVLVDIANGLVDRGFEVNVVSFSRTSYYPLDERINQIIVPGEKERIFKKVRLLAKAIPKSDIVLANFFLTAYSAVFAKAGKNFYYVQGYEPNFFPNDTKMKWAAHLSYLLPMRITAGSSYLSDILKRKYKRKSFVINPGIDIGNFYPADYKKPPVQFYHLIYAGRLSEEKFQGFKDLLTALRSLWDSGFSFDLWVASQERKELYRGFRIRFFPVKDAAEMREVFWHADLLIQPSWEEGFSMVPLEAMASGLPVVTTDCGGPRDYAKNYYNSLVVPIKSPKLLEEAIFKALTDEYLWLKLRENGIETVKQFTIERMVDAFEDEFLRALHK